MDLPPIYAALAIIMMTSLRQKWRNATLGHPLTARSWRLAYREQFRRWDDFLEEAGRTLQAAIKGLLVCSSSVTASQTNICARWKITAAPEHGLRHRARRDVCRR